MATEDKLAKLLEKNIEASNRTTHAVRALVLFLFIQLSFLTAAAVLWQLGLAFPDENNCSILGCEPNGVVTFLVVALVIAGVVISSMAGWEEIRKSNVEYVAEDVMDADQAEKNRIQAEALKKAEEERERQALIEQARIQKEEEVRLRERRELLEKRKRKLLVALKKPWVIGLSALLVLVSGAGAYLVTTSWGFKVSQCDYLMADNPYLGSDDSYGLDYATNELTLIVGNSPNLSQWLTCIEQRLSVGAPDTNLGVLLSEVIVEGKESTLVYGNLSVKAIKLDAHTNRIIISPNK